MIYNQHVDMSVPSSATHSEHHSNCSTHYFMSTDYPKKHDNMLQASPMRHTEHT